ncbi:MAG: hypothetical protein ABSC95_14730 [Acetobacteraceae bacterium]
MSDSRKSRDPAARDSHGPQRQRSGMNTAACRAWLSDPPRPPGGPPEPEPDPDAPPPIQEPPPPISIPPDPSSPPVRLARRAATLSAA